MTDKVMYAVLRRGFEYNDESYEYQEGGNVVTLYSSVKLAQDAAREMTKGMLADLHEYLDGYSSFDRIRDIMLEDEDEDAWDVDWRDRFGCLDSERQKKVLDLIGDHFFFVEEVPVGA